MVVTCPECSTKFSLDESRIPGPAAKVRCSRCSHVFRITRAGEIVPLDWQPPGEPQPAVPPAEAAREEPPAPPPPEPAPVGPPADKELAAAPTPAAAPPVETPSPPRKSRHWLWLPALLLAAVVLVGLGWRAWVGDLPGPLKPLGDAVQRLKGKQPPPQQPLPASGQETAGPAPTQVTPPPPPKPAPDLTELAVDWAEAHYQGLVNDKGGGQLLLIQGEVINKGKSPRGPIRLKATLTDSQHRPLREEMVYTGTTVTDTELKTLNPEVIKDWLGKPGGRSQERLLKPGDKQPFTVVFFGVPGNLAETQAGFQLLVVEGPPAP